MEGNGPWLTEKMHIGQSEETAALSAKFAMQSDALVSSATVVLARPVM